jgi:hypothetical protein
MMPAHPVSTTNRSNQPPTEKPEGVLYRSKLSASTDQRLRHIDLPPAPIADPVTDATVPAVRREVTTGETAPAAGTGATTVRSETTHGRGRGRGPGGEDRRLGQAGETGRGRGKATGSRQQKIEVAEATAEAPVAMKGGMSL